MVGCCDVGTRGAAHDGEPRRSGTRCGPVRDRHWGGAAGSLAGTRVPAGRTGNPLRYTLCYLLLADAGVVVVDPGWESDTGWADLERGLATAGVPADRISGIVVTHVHLDHHGLSRRLSEMSGAWIAMP